MAFKPQEEAPVTKASRLASLEGIKQRWEEVESPGVPWPNADEIEKLKKGGKDS